MKKLLITTLAMLMILGLFTACGNAPEEELPQNTETPSAATVDPSALHLTAEEDEPANGFLWAHNYSEITITGYVGASNDIVIPETINGKPVTTIRKEAFSGFSAMKSLVVPGSIKTMDSAFKRCTSLTSVTLGEGIESMNYAFQECTALTEIVLPNSIVEMNSAFVGCTALVEVEIPEGVTSVRAAFNNCTSLKRLVIPESAVYDANNIVSSIRDLCGNCTALETLILPFPNWVTFVESTTEYISDINYVRVSIQNAELENLKKFVWGDYEYEIDATGNIVRIK